MKNLSIQIFFSLILASLVVATPVLQKDELPVQIIQNESYDTETGHHFAYATNDGQQRDEELIIKNKGTEDEEIVISGHYSYKGSDGLIYNVNYTADKNGYHATVDAPRVDGVGLLPIAPGLPAASFVPAAPIPARSPNLHRFN